VTDPATLHALADYYRVEAAEVARAATGYVSARRGGKTTVTRYVNGLDALAQHVEAMDELSSSVFASHNRNRICACRICTLYRSLLDVAAAAEVKL
jgi:hypothetical protein